MKRLLVALALALTTSAMDASKISVVATKFGVQGSQPGRTLYVAFADEPVTVDVTASIDESGPELDATRWWQQLDWTLTETVTKVEKPIAARSIDVVSATRNPLMTGSLSQHRGLFRIGKLPPGNYLLRISAENVQGADAFAIRKGDETPFIHDKHLERRAERSRSFSEYKALQLERANLFPNRADVWIALATRALEQGTQSDATEYYDRTIAIMEKNAADLSKQNPSRAKEIRQRVATAVAQVKALREALPYYYANRDRLRVAEEPIDGAMRYVLKDRRSGRIDRVIQ